MLRRNGENTVFGCLYLVIILDAASTTFEVKYNWDKGDLSNTSRYVTI
jgi:hypothetical protein